MLDVSSSPKNSTCANVNSTSSTLRSVLNAIAIYRGTTYYNPQRMIVGLVAACLEELGFDVTVENSSGYYNHIVLNDYATNVCLQLYNLGASACNISFLYPRHSSGGISVSSTFNNGTACRATIRMLGNGPGKIKTLLLLGSDSTPTLFNTNCVYFTEAKYLPTGETKKAIVCQSGSTYYFYIYDSDWSFLPGFDSELTTAANMNSYWYNLSCTIGYRNCIDPYSSYKFFREQSYFPEIPVISNNGLWEFSDIILNPFGQVLENDTAESLKYSLTAGNIYQIGNKKYLCNAASSYHYLYRVA